MGSRHGYPVLWRLTEPPPHDGPPLDATAVIVCRLFQRLRGAPGFCVSLPAGETPVPDEAERCGELVETARRRLVAGEPETGVDLRVCVVGADPTPLAFLNILGGEATKTAVLELLGWARKHHTGQGVLLMVHRFVAARATAVARLSDTDTVRISACWGLGEDLHLPGVHADTFVLKRSHDGPDLTFAGVDCAIKPWMDVPAVSGAIRASTPSHLRNVPSLSEEEALDVGRRALTAINLVGHSVPVEFALTSQGTLLRGTGGGI
ncbi:hypothetical protein ACQPYK_13310 [Streptosporangium sp. CA-135522]|uniref:hypothetical protein n=1 Tax=Streptosporangium sp. CA-135522 TaxID=3240072 RepID=UPI003D90A14E